MLYLVGLGLGDEKDITLKGLEAVRNSHKVFIEAYTSLLCFGDVSEDSRFVSDEDVSEDESEDVSEEVTEDSRFISDDSRFISEDSRAKLEALYGKSVTLADREMVEEKADEILLEARSKDISFLVVGDPFGATTHTDLFVRAKKLGVEVKVIHNASVMNAIGVCGLQLYRYGETISIPFFTDTCKPDSFYDRIQANRKLGLHTLCLLDIKVKEPSLKSLARGKKEYEEPKYMKIKKAIEQLLELEKNRGENVFNEETKCVGFARLGSEDQMIVAGSMKQLQEVEFGNPLHCLVIVGKLHDVEEEMLDFFALKNHTV